MTMSEANPTADDLLVRKHIFVKASLERAFEVFTRDMGRWWPLATHHIGKADAATAVVEPFAGGRWFERGVDGSECDWGRVLAYEPPRRVLLTWDLTHEWKHDASLQTEVEVRFSDAGAEGVRVDLEHRLLRAYGDKAEHMQKVFDSPGGWTGIMESFRKRASGS